MDPSLQTLLSRVERLPEQLREAREGVQRAIRIADQDPDMALTRSRKVLELVVREVYERRCREPPGTRPLENLLQRLVRDGFLPTRLDAYANTVRMLGNVGTHRFGEQVTTADVGQSLSQLMPILEWYGEEEKPGGSSPVAASEPASFAPVRGLASSAAVVPRGMCSFDAQDSDFFLELLPGPRHRNGLPDSLHFWKTRIEMTSERAFTVGLVYGPSGCGKSSLIKAGLLPRLDPSVQTVYVEATPQGTEARLAKKLAHLFPDLDPSLELPEMVARLRQSPRLGLDDLGSLGGLAGPGDHGGRRKVLLVIDQLEQWLHANGRTMRGSKLLAALRQADGERVQCLVLLRDDFWAAATRMFRELNLRMQENENVYMVDLFNLDHARHVLELFGVAYGQLPASPTERTPDHKQFLDRAVAGLSQDGLVICVRLSLFAHMMSKRPWTVESLKKVGGTEGVGLKFLEETFTARWAVPEHRALAKPARALLQALLPEEDTTIKGRMRAHDELAQASGLADKPEQFARLLEVLDRELHILTPTQPESDVEENGDASRSQGYYQLTHDYLVPLLRQWLTQERSKTWRGRAELRLEILTAWWIRSRRSRFLPSLLEYWTIVRGVPRWRRTPDQQACMRAATRYFGAWAAALLVLAGGLFWGIREVSGRLQADRLVESIAAADPGELETLIDRDLPPYRAWADPLLRQVVGDPSARLTARLHASLALLPVDEDQRLFLSEQLLTCSVEEFGLVRKSLRPFRAPLLPGLWAKLRDSQAATLQRFFAGMTLAGFVPESGEWSDADAAFLTDQLLSSNPDKQYILRSYLRPIAGRLLKPLQVRFREKEQRPGLVRSAAAAALVDYAGDEPELLAQLAADAVLSSQFKIVFQALTAKRSYRETAVATLRNILAEKPAPALSQSERVRLGFRRAGAAIGLIHLKEHETALAAFAFGDDLEAITQFAFRWRNWDLTAEDLLVCLDKAVDDHSRFCLVLSLGELGPDEVPPARLPALIDRLSAWYAGDPSSGIHAACGWLLRTWDKDDPVRKIDDTPRPCDRSGKRQWFVEKAGGQAMTFVVFPPGDYYMGSPTWDSLRETSEGQHRVRLTQPFAICDREVTRGQLARFFEATRLSSDQAQFRQWSPTPAHPAVGASWFDAILFCRWLTKEAGLKESDQCYDNPDGLKKGPDGYPLDWPFHPERAGFRLPTEAEWEYACRCGTTTAFSFGNDREMLGRHGWFQDNADRRTHVGGRLRPSVRGLFDMHGNVFEWCHDRFASYAVADQTDPLGPPVNPQRPGEQSRLLRGGAWEYALGSCRSATRLFFLPTRRMENFGFRLVRGAAAVNGTKGP
jgi:formylglycine-generating enzyme required for sulfatase activity